MGEGNELHSVLKLSPADPSVQNLNPLKEQANGAACREEIKEEGRKGIWERNFKVFWEIEDLRGLGIFGILRVKCRERGCFWGLWGNRSVMWSIFYEIFYKFIKITNFCNCIHHSFYQVLNNKIRRTRIIFSILY
ncbi:unnamed protein product [Moneuplotes crassus]|uniref:Uncharacterized protein n=1 Tax=Euplotes crassus TaxID=5936 RepID=A0AAD1Y6C2_EUPCR|nr:unnamed protein product [Moneuplotes crassus]